MKSFASVLRISAILLAILLNTPQATPSPAPPVHVLLWFDTEDYLLPADDDACKRLAQMLTQRDIRATFKIVGEKARVLDQRHRRDVISALKKHDIAYHTDYHSVHPTVAEYLAEAGWQDGVAEFIRREGQGARDVRRIFSVKTLSCYGQPGSSWAPQAIGALKALSIDPKGVPCYVDEGDHIGLDHKPFWYINALNVYNIGPNCTRMDLHDPAAIAPAMEKVSAIAERLRKNPDAALISIYYHPCEWVHKQFWDGVNFSRGANPPREEWQIPPQLTKEQTDAAFDRFGKYIDHINRIPGVKWITATDLPRIYPDSARSKAVSQQDLTAIAKHILDRKGQLDYLLLGDRAYSVADQLELLTLAVNNLTEGKPQSSITPRGLIGPDALPPVSTRQISPKWLAFRDTLRDVTSFIQAEQRVPSRVFVATDLVAPADFLTSLASVYSSYLDAGKLPGSQVVSIPTGTKLLPERHIAQDRPGLYGGWVIHVKDFQAPKLLEVARLQAWTLKPAIRRAEK